MPQYDYEDDHQGLASLDGSSVTPLTHKSDFLHMSHDLGTHIGPHTGAIGEP